jgi:hypothetical protein
MRVDEDGLRPQSRQTTKPADSQVVHSTSRGWPEGKESHTGSAPSGEKGGLDQYGGYLRGHDAFWAG